MATEFIPCYRCGDEHERSRLFKLPVHRAPIEPAPASDNELAFVRRTRYGLFCDQCVAENAPAPGKDRVEWSLKMGELKAAGKCLVCGGNIHRFGGCNICDMLKSRKAPKGVTDDTRFEGFSKVGGAQFTNDEVREQYTGVAKRAGVDITGKQYFSELAAFPGDPEAWVDSQGDMRRLLEKRGWGSTGDLKVKAREMEVAPTHPKLADDIVEDLVEDALYDRHGPLDEARVSVKEFNEVRDAVIETHSAPSHLSG